MGSAVYLTDQEMGDLVRTFATLDLGDWTNADFERALRQLGWQGEAEPQGLLAIQTGLPTGPGAAWPCVVDFRYDGYHRLRLPLVRGGGHARAIVAFRAARRLTEDLLGPAVLLGGPGPWLRWRRPGASLWVTFASNLPDAQAADVYLELRCTQRFAPDDRGRSYKWTPEDPRYLWCMQVIPDDVDLIRGIYWPGYHLSEDWIGLQQGLAQTLGSLLSDLPVLGERPMSLLIQGREDRSPEDLVSCLLKLSEDRLEFTCSIGLNPSTSRSGGCTHFVPVTPESAKTDGEEVARLVIQALRDNGCLLSELTLRVWQDSEPTQVSLTSVGLEVTR